MDPVAKGGNWDYKFDALRILFAIYFSILFLLQSQVVFEVTNVFKVFRIFLFLALIIAVVTILLYPLPQPVCSGLKKIRNTYVITICRVIIYAYLPWIIWTKFLT